MDTITGRIFFQSALRIERTLDTRVLKRQNSNIQTKDSHRPETLNIEFPDPFKSICIVEVKKGKRLKL